MYCNVTDIVEACNPWRHQGEFALTLADKLTSDVAARRSQMRLSSTPNAATFALREFVVHPSRNIIQDQITAYRVEPKIMDVLIALAESQGDVFLREELITKVWGNRPGGDERLTRAISKLRKILRDNPQDPVFLETVPKRGYRLACVVEPVQCVERRPAALRRR